MENKLALQALPLTEVMSMAETFSKSGMFTDAKDQAQAFVKIIAGQEIGIPPFAAISGIHIVKGKPTIGAGLIASCIKGSGKYDYKVKQLDDKACAIEFFQGKESLGISTFTIDDAKKAQTQNLEKFPRNMLFARAISNGVKWYCPDVFSGPVYTPEEMNATTEDIDYTIVPPVTNAVQIEAPTQTENVDESTGDVILPQMPDARYKKLITSIKADGAKITDILKMAREQFSFTDEQEEEFNQIIADAAARKQAA